jgi:hypothetical protein
MSGGEAAEFLERECGRQCVRFYRRPDGTLMTGQCGRVEKARLRIRAVIVAITTLVGMLLKGAEAQPKLAEEDEVTMGKAAVPYSSFSESKTDLL